MSIKITGLQAVEDTLAKEFEKIFGGAQITVGIHESSGMVDDGQMTVAKLGAIQHYGADIDHPGGTRYVIGKNGKAHFVSNDFVGPVSGVTAPHKIKIPARPWLDVGAESGNKEYFEAIEEAVSDGLTAKQVMEKVGVLAVSATQDYVLELDTPPNAPSTIAKKGSDNPLIDTGNMMQSITYEIAKKKPEIGLE